jgi:aspartokinase/homoserine dehydrogenase 2
MTHLNLASQLTVDENTQVSQRINVHKFGGSSLATCTCITRVLNIIISHCQVNDIIVVSANGDTTDQLFSLVALAKSKDARINDTLEKLTYLQSTLINGLLPDSSAVRLNLQLMQDIQQIQQWLVKIDNHQNDILAFGEVWSARLLAALINEKFCASYAVDARTFLQVNNSRECEVDQVSSSAQFRLLNQNNKLAVITGYIAKDKQGNTCTLGRNGSDYSATIIAALINANKVTLWTDVDGIYSADPRIVPKARKLHRLPNEVAQELGCLGNSVLHANTLKPLNNSDISLFVASSYDAQISGTEIGDFGVIAKQELSITYLNDLVMVKSTALTGKKLRQAAQLVNCICSDAAAGFMVIRQSEQQAVQHWLTDTELPVYYTDCAIAAVVGYQVASKENIKACFTRSLQNNQLLAIVESVNQHSVIALLSRNCSDELVNQIHHQVTQKSKQIGLVVAGLGNIGQRFLALLPEQLSKIPALEHAHLVGLLSSTKMLINTDGIDAKHALNTFSQQAINYQQQDFIQWLKTHAFDELVVIDITPSEKFSDCYLDFFQQGVHVIGANKWAASSNYENYQKLSNTAKKMHCLWLGNTTVGAGLPINYTIEDLRNSGDYITEISGIFSGTLSWLFEKYDGSVAFSQLLLDALAQGITEPDPREDLSGRDVQRKLLILARLAGYSLSLDDIHCQNLVPPSLQKITRDEFLLNAHKVDDFFAKQLINATEQNACIRYVAKLSVNNDKLIAEVKLVFLAEDHAFAKLTPGDTIFQIKSKWYQDKPLIIRGPGAGRDVTAGGLYSDLVKICQQLTDRNAPETIKGINE